MLWYDKDADHMAAVASYYSLFAVVPLIVITATIEGWLYGSTRVVGTLYDWGSILGPDILNLLHQAARNMQELSVDWHLPFVGSLFFSGMVIILFNTVATSLNNLWSVPHRGFKGWLSKCYRSIFFTIMFEMYLVAITGFSMWLDIIDHYIWSSLSSLLSALFFIFVTTILFDLAYRLLPWHPPSKKSCLRGALLASLLLAIVKSLVVMYISFTPVPGLFGAAGIMLVLLLWLFVFTAVFYFGAAFAYVYNGKQVN